MSIPSKVFIVLVTTTPFLGTAFHLARNEFLDGTIEVTTGTITLGFILFSIAAFFSILIANFSSLNNYKQPVKFARPIAISTGVFLFLYLMAMTFFVVVYIAYFRVLGFIPILNLDRYFIQGHSLMSGYGYLKAICDTVLPVSLFFIGTFIYRRVRRKKSFILGASLLCLIPASLVLLLGQRGFFVLFILSHILLISTYAIKITLTRLILGSIVAVLLTVGLGLARANLIDGHSFQQIFLLEHHSEYSNYLKLIENKKEVVPTNNTFISAITLLIPRKIYPEKDVWQPAGVVFSESLNHNFVAVGERITLLGEFLMNYGYVAGLLVWCLAVLIWIKIVTFPIITVNETSVIYAVLFSFLTISFFYGDFTSFFYALITYIVPVQVLKTIFNNLFSRGASN